MKTLEQHNADRHAIREAFRKVANAAGVACDKCGEQMYYDDPNTVYTSDPPVQRVRCHKCGYYGLKTA